MNRDVKCTTTSHLNIFHIQKKVHKQEDALEDNLSEYEIQQKYKLQHIFLANFVFKKVMAVAKRKTI